MSSRPHSREHRPHVASFMEDFRRYGDQIAVVSRSGLRRTSLTYAELAHRAGRFAALLEARQIRKGDRVLLWGESGGAWLAAFWGCVMRGVIVVPLDASGAPEFAGRIIRDVSPKLVVCDRERLSSVAGTAAIALEDLFVVLPFDLLPAPVEGLSAADILQIVFTSGTTGDPKGIVHTHRNVLASLSPIEQEIGKYLRWERPFHPLRFLVTIPLSHVFGQFMGIWIPPLLAAEVYLESRTVASELVRTIHRERISVLAAVPRVLEILRSDFELRFPDLATRSARLAAARPGSPVVSAFRRWWAFRDVHHALGLKFWAVVSGGAMLNESLETSWKALGFVVVQGYGMTETTALVSLTHPFKPLRAGHENGSGGYVGKVLSGRDVRLGPDGEVLVRGEMISQSTWEGGRLHPRESPWLATGDVASLDESGGLRFRGRKKNVIVTASGLNIYPEDLEAALLRQPSIKAAAVVEIAGPKGAEPMAALVMNAAGDAAEAVRRANAELAEYQQIRRWTIWPEPDLPRGPTGKILHRVVAAQLNQVASVASSTPATDTGALAQLVANITTVDPASLNDASLLSEDLHLDSLGRVELQSALETRFGIALDDAAYQNVKIVGDLRHLLQIPPSMQMSAPTQETGSPRTQQAAATHEQHSYPTWPWSLPVRVLRIFFLELIVRPLVWLLAAPRVIHNAEVKSSTPLLIVANHVTIFDVPLILFALPFRIRYRVAVAMAGELLLDWRKARNQGNSFLNLLAPAAYWLVTALFNVFPLPQAANFRASFAHAGRAMDRGYNVLVFPEGRRTPDQQMHAFQTGSGILWKDLRTSALPVCLGGVNELKAQRASWFRSGKLLIRVGRLLAPLPDGDPAAAACRLEDAVGSLANSRKPSPANLST